MYVRKDLFPVLPIRLMQGKEGFQPLVEQSGVQGTASVVLNWGSRSRGQLGFQTLTVRMRVVAEVFEAARYGDPNLSGMWGHVHGGKEVHGNETGEESDAQIGGLLKKRISRMTFTLNYTLTLIIRIMPCHCLSGIAIGWSTMGMCSGRVFAEATLRGPVFAGLMPLLPMSNIGPRAGGVRSAQFRLQCIAFSSYSLQLFENLIVT